MLDPGALGTLLIGLDAIRREQEQTDHPVERRPRREPRPAVRMALVKGLRGLADMLEANARSSGSSEA